MRLLLVTNDYPPRPGGIQQYLSNLVAHHPGPVRVLAPADPAADQDERVVRHGARFMWPTPQVRSWVVEHARSFAADIVVFGAPHPLAQLGPGVAGATGLPYAVLTHGAEFVIPNRVPGLRRLVVEPLRRADVVFAVSDFTRRLVEHATGRAAIRLGAGVDLDRFHPAERPPDGLVLGCISRFVPRKGHETVIDAGELLARRGREVSVLLAGSGRLENRLRKRAGSATVPVEVRAGLSWDELPETYRRMTVFAMPARSRWGGLEVEGLGIVYLEAAASGLPVVAGTSGGAPETVVPGVTGYVADTAAGVADAVELMLHGDRLADMGRAARARAESEFAWPVVAGRWASALRAAVSGTLDR